MKAIISGSTVFQEDYLQLQKDFKDKGVDVIDYPRFSQNLTAEYPQILTSFFKNIEAADIFFLFNQDKNGVSGRIGAASFSELTYCLMQNLIHNKKIKIILFKEPSKENFCFDEVSLWLENEWVEVASLSFL
ncbi:hypothetical protein [Candidatus Enterococcus murrayae]|uniref:DUF4062 domain-containing protein n=1 Tax=Candidatus Enterococcus murrayae TaxID=2815321 RepID=A0ABS3HGK8_9ENTE|nr:hypothetical protein [Enterococcus sp. MJM16]MBO0452408.1 hypothetical protein [Enterococcus sp. MJM16]